MNDLSRLTQHLSSLCNTDALPLILSFKTLQRFCALPIRIETLQNATNNNSRKRSLFLQKLSKIFLLHLQILYFNLAMLAAILYLYKFQNCFTVSINFQIFFPKYMHSSCTKPMKESLVYCFV